MADWNPWLAENLNHSLDTDTGAMTIEHDDGSITIDLSPQPKDYMGDSGDVENLAEELDDYELAKIAGDLLEGIDADDASRSTWLEMRAKGMDLLGLKLEASRGDLGGPGGSSLSTVRHPLLLEAVLRFQANARGELLPTDGPVKVRNDAVDEAYFEDTDGAALEKDMNHYLTVTATEYYPDSDRMFMHVGYGGAGVKKVYRCPLRNRPVSESVDVKDFIVSDAVTDLANASRITHVIRMRPSVLKRMQLLGVYRDVDLSLPTEAPNAIDAKAAAIDGVSATHSRVEDAEHTIYECYCELDIKGYEHKQDGEITGLPLPYKVSIEKDSRQILEIVPNYVENDGELPIAREVFVMFPFAPGFGFWPIGLLNILGNTTNAVTAAWRIMLDAGMFSNFPGFLYLQTAKGRQMTNEFIVPPGGGAAVEAQPGTSIGDIIMPLPYKEPSAALMTLTENIVGAGQRVGGTSDQPVGEGKQDAPVGTTLALIEQATKVESAVHKRLHQAQSKEFQLLKALFEDDPEALFRNNNRAKLNSEAAVRRALTNRDLVPQADPNTHSRMHRGMKTAGLLQLNKEFPGQMPQAEVLKRALEMLQIGDVQSLLAPQTPAQPPVDPYKMGQLQISAGKLDLDRARLAYQRQNDATKRVADENMQLLKMATESIIHPEGEQAAETALARIPQFLPQRTQGQQLQ